MRFQTVLISEVAQSLATGVPPAGIVSWRQGNSGAADTSIAAVPASALGPGTCQAFVLATVPASIDRF